MVPSLGAQPAQLRRGEVRKDWGVQTAFGGAGSPAGPRWFSGQNMSRRYRGQSPGGPLACVGDIKGGQMMCGGWGSCCSQSPGRGVGTPGAPQPLPGGREPAALTSWLRSLPEGDGVASEAQPAPTLSWETWGMWTLRRVHDPASLPHSSVQLLQACVCPALPCSVT